MSTQSKSHLHHRCHRHRRHRRRRTGSAGSARDMRRLMYAPAITANGNIYLEEWRQHMNLMRKWSTHQKANLITTTSNGRRNLRLERLIMTRQISHRTITFLFFVFLKRTTTAIEANHYYCKCLCIGAGWLARKTAEGSVVVFFWLCSSLDGKERNRENEAVYEV